MLGFASTEHTVDCVSVQAQSACGENKLLGELTVELQNAVEVHRSDRLHRPSCAAPHNRGSSGVLVHSIWLTSTRSQSAVMGPGDQKDQRTGGHQCGLCRLAHQCRRLCLLNGAGCTASHTRDSALVEAVAVAVHPGGRLWSYLFSACPVAHCTPSSRTSVIAHA